MRKPYILSRHPNEKMTRMEDHLRLATFNLASWVSTLVSMQLLKDIGQLMALGGSIAVSIVSLWWIYRQNLALDAKMKDNK